MTHCFFSHHCNIDRLFALWQDCHDFENAGYNLTTAQYQAINNIDPITKLPYMDYSQTSQMPYFWTNTDTGAPIPTTPAPRDVYGMGNPGAPGFDGMFYRYGSDELVTSFSTDAKGRPFCTANLLGWNLVNQSLPGTSKRDIDGVNGYRVSAVYRLLQIMLRRAISLTPAEALQFVAQFECQQSAPVEITDDLEAWIVMQGTTVQQYDRICDKLSTRYCNRKRVRALARGCPPNTEIEESASYVHIGGVSVSYLVVTLVSVIVTIVLVVSIVVGVLICRRKSAVVIEDDNVQYTALE